MAASALSPAIPTSRGSRRRGQPLEPLSDGHTVMCPHCRVRHHILDVPVLPEMPVYRAETVPILQCPRCTFLFAPASKPTRPLE